MTKKKMLYNNLAFFCIGAGFAGGLLGYLTQDYALFAAACWGLPVLMLGLLVLLASQKLS